VCIDSTIEATGWLVGDDRLRLTTERQQNLFVDGLRMPSGGSLPTYLNHCDDFLCIAYRGNKKGSQPPPPGSSQVPSQGTANGADGDICHLHPEFIPRVCKP